MASQGDQAGNTGVSAARTFRIDTTAPAVTITSLGTCATEKLRKAGRLKCTAVVKTTDAAGQTSTVRVNYTFKAKKKK